MDLEMVSNIKMMTSKATYITPSAKSFEFVHESVICDSEVKGDNSIDDWGEGGTTDDDLYL